MNKKLLIGIIVAVLLVAAIISGVLFIDLSDKDNDQKQVPVYKGMTVNTDSMEALSADHLVVELFSYKPNDTKFSPVSSVSDYTAKLGENINIYIHIDNPDNFEIVSFTLNGNKYSNYMFENGSDMETLILKYNVGTQSGNFDYTIDAIKYIDGTEIKDVKIDGDRTITVSVLDKISAEICEHKEEDRVLLEAKEPSCSEEGLTEGVKCGACDTVLVPQKTISMLSHTFGTWTSVLEPTFSDPGVERRECSCGEFEERDIAPFGYDGSEVTIVFYHTMGSSLRSVLDEYLVKFNEMYPNIHVIHDPVGGYDDVFDVTKVQLTVGNQANIVFCYPEHVAVYNTFPDAVLDLNLYINSQDAMSNGEVFGLTATQKNDFIDAFYAGGSVFGDNKMYTLPLAKSTELLYYNKTFFEEHGLSVPTTWDEMEEVCRIIKEIDPDCIPLGYDSEANLFITLCAQLGSPYISATGEHFVFDNEANRAFVKRIMDWYSKGYLITKELSGSYTSNLLVNERIYMSIGSSAGASYNVPEGGFECGVASIPQVDPRNPKIINQGPSLCILKNENNQENAAAWLLMKFLTTNSEFQAEYSMTARFMPVIESVMDVPAYREFIENADCNENIGDYAIKISLAQSNAYFNPDAFPGSAIARDQVGHLITNCMYATKESEDFDSIIDKAFKDAINECRNQS